MRTLAAHSKARCSSATDCIDDKKKIKSSSAERHNRKRPSPPHRSTPRTPARLPVGWLFKVTERSLRAPISFESSATTLYFVTGSRNYPNLLRKCPPSRGRTARSQADPNFAECGAPARAALIRATAAARALNPDPAPQLRRDRGRPPPAPAPAARPAARRARAQRVAPRGPAEASRRRVRSASAAVALTFRDWLPGVAGSLSQRRGDRTAAISAAGAAAGLARRSAAAARPGLAPRPAPPPLPLRGVATAPTGQPGHERGASRSSCSAPLRAARGDPGPRRRTGTRPVTPRGPGAAAPPPLLPPPRPPPPPAAAAAAARAAARPSRERGADPPRQRLGSSAARRGSIPRAWWAPSAAAAVRRGSWPLQGWAAPSPARQPGTSYVCEPSTSAGGVYGGRGGAFAGSRCERSPPRGGRLKPAPPLRGRSERAAASPHPLRPRPAPLPQPYLAGEPPSAPRLGPHAAPPAPQNKARSHSHAGTAVPRLGPPRRAGSCRTAGTEAPALPPEPWAWAALRTAGPPSPGHVQG